MLEVLVDGKTAWLVNHQPDWTTQPILRVSVPVSIERGITGRENRRTTGDTLRTELDWQATLSSAEAQSLLAGLQNYAGVPIVVPIWPLARCGPGSTGLITGLLVAWRRDGTEWAVGSDIGDPDDWEWIAPAIWGAFSKPPEATALTPELFRVDFSGQEDGPVSYALVPPPVTFTDGPALPDGSQPPVFPWQVNWTNTNRAATAELDLERREMGPGRESARAIYPQESERPVEGLVTFSGAADIATFLAWWLAEGANADGHWTSSMAASTRLTANASAGDSVLAVASSESLVPELAVFLQSAYGPPEAARIASVSGTTVTLSGPLTYAWEKDETVLTPLMLARHARAVVELAFYSLEVAEARVAWREVSAEDILTGDEIRGSTIGRLPGRAWLYTLQSDRGGIISTERFTSYETNLAVGSDGFISRPCDHSEIRQTIKLDRDEITLSLRWWDGCSLAVFLPGQLDTLVYLTIDVCEPRNGVGLNPHRMFNGQITGVEFDGPYLQASAAGASSLFDRIVPTLLFSRVCNWDVYGTGCSLDRADWEFTADVQSVTGSRIVIHNIVVPSGEPAWAFAAVNSTEDWFSLGVIWRGDRTAASFITRSSILSAGSINLELDRPLSPEPAPGETVVLVPGCDGRSVTCQKYNATTNPEGKFNNFPNFGGFPELPDTNPVVQPKSKNTGAGKK